jgi:Asp-tRNA(Asn)/Glu-tRNA(Gln) amidotransferase A subunit family amidase
VLGNYGCKIRRITPPPSWQLLTDAVVLIQTYEGARSMEPHYTKHGNAIGAKLSQLVRDGLAMPVQQYEDALGVLNLARHDMAEVFETFPVLLSPAAPGPAPSGLAFTGNPRCNAPWTGLHTPAMTIPIPVGDQLPMGLQMAAATGHDAQLIATACHCFALLAAGGSQT